MPRNVRNFWIETSIEGRETIKAGPRAKDGQIGIVIYMRQDGVPVRALEIDGLVTSDGQIKLEVIPKTSEVTVRPFADGRLELSTQR